MTEPIFVQSPLDIFEGEHALRKLATINDSAYETGDGVVSVPDERWQIAQEYERYSWLVHNTALETDRNEYHMEQFGDYATLPANLGKVIELGCGPFTNLRLILPERKADSVFLLDPLVKQYQKAHPNCSYRDGTLAGHEVTLVDSAIEDWNTRLKFDTIVMVNVIPHCRDGLAVLDFIRKRLKSGGLLVIGEFPREHPARLHYDAGHPIALKAHILDDFLSEYEEIYRNGWYFVGRGL